MKIILKTVFLPLAISLIALLLLFFSALIPQCAIQHNSEISSLQLLKQEMWPTPINDDDPTYKLDNYTDSQAIMQAYNLNSDNLLSIFTNPKHISKSDPSNMAVALDEVVNQKSENELSYCRYWMGFRFIIRPLLVVADYFTIRKIIALVFWVLLLSLMGLMGKRKNMLSVLVLGTSVALMNPAIISQSIQFSCCFILSFIFSAIILKIDIPESNLPLLFCSFGAITQLFDFYSTPLITYGLPIIIILSTAPATCKRWISSIKAFAAWAYGYASIWLLKLLYVTLFTDINGFVDGFGSFSGRVGITVTEGLEDKYDPVLALRLVCRNVFPGTLGKLAFIAIILVSVAAVITCFITYTRKEFLSYCALIFIAILPIVWFICTAQPTVIHYWFQYRTVCMTFAALFEYFIIAFAKIPPLIKSRNQPRDA